MTRCCGLMVAVVGLMIMASAQPAAAQRGGRQGPPGGFRGAPGGMRGMMGGGMMGGGALGLLAREDVQKELELLEDQIQDLQKIGEELRSSARDRFTGMQDLSREERMAKMRDIFGQIQKETQEKVDKILLPHQSDRLAQLEVQSRMRGGLEAMLRDEELSSKLGITDAQRDKISEKARALQEEMRQKMAELRKQMQGELAKELTPQQRSTLEKLIGKPFEFQQQQPRMRGRGEGRAGGAGGFGARRSGRPG